MCSPFKCVLYYCGVLCPKNLTWKPYARSSHWNAHTTTYIWYMIIALVVWSCLFNVALCEEQRCLNSPDSCLRSHNALLRLELSSFFFYFGVVICVGWKYKRLWNIVTQTNTDHNQSTLCCSFFAFNFNKRLIGNENVGAPINNDLLCLSTDLTETFINGNLLIPFPSPSRYRGEGARVALFI